jgi:hypothetical protein
MEHIHQQIKEGKIKQGDELARFPTYKFEEIDDDGNIIFVSRGFKIGAVVEYVTSPAGVFSEWTETYVADDEKLARKVYEETLDAVVKLFDEGKIRDFHVCLDRTRAISMLKNYIGNYDVEILGLEDLDYCEETREIFDPEDDYFRDREAP